MDIHHIVMDIQFIYIPNRYCDGYS